MVKIIFSIFFLFIVVSLRAQTPAVIITPDTNRLDTIPMIIPVLDTTRNYDIYNSANKLLKHNADSFYPVPAGGRRVKLGLANNNKQYIEGFEVFRTRIDFNMEIVDTLDATKQPIGPPFIEVGVGLPRGGW